MQQHRSDRMEGQRPPVACFDAFHTLLRHRLLSFVARAFWSSPSGEFSDVGGVECGTYSLAELFLILLL